MLVYRLLLVFERTISAVVTKGDPRRLGLTTTRHRIGHSTFLGEPQVCQEVNQSPEPFLTDDTALHCAGFLLPFYPLSDAPKSVSSESAGLLLRGIIIDMDTPEPFNRDKPNQEPERGARFVFEWLHQNANDVAQERETARTQLQNAQKEGDEGMCGSSELLSTLQSCVSESLQRFPRRDTPLRSRVWRCAHVPLPSESDRTVGRNKAIDSPLAAVLFNPQVQCLSAL